MRGERLGLGGWLRQLGFQEKAPPERVWDLRHVSIVSDESDLTSASVGPRAVFGGQVAAGVGQHSCIEITAGERGCRVVVDMQVGDPSAVLTVHQIIQFQVLSAPVLGTSADFTLYNQTATPVLTRARVGNLADAAYNTQFPTGTSPAYATVATTVGGVSTANSFFHIGGGALYKPHLWLDPGRVLLIGGQGSGNALGWYVSGYIEEPGSARL